MKLTKTLALVGMISLASIKAGKGMDPVAEDLTWQQKHIYIKQFVSERLDVETAYKYTRKADMHFKQEFVEYVYDNLFSISDSERIFLHSLETIQNDVVMKHICEFSRKGQIMLTKLMLEKLEHNLGRNLND